MIAAGARVALEQAVAVVTADLADDTATVTSLVQDSDDQAALAVALAALMTTAVQVLADHRGESPDALWQRIALIVARGCEAS